MPELPEVETTRRGLASWVEGQRVVGWKVRNPLLRWPVQIPQRLRDQRLTALKRRGKYLLFEFPSGTLIVHLGMSGSLRLVAPDVAPGKHDHVDLCFTRNLVVRLNDPRRFGSVLWWPCEEASHRLLAHLGVEPLSAEFVPEYLKKTAKNRKLAVKNFIMDSRVVVGVGNIYAAEALFLAGIRPTVPAGRVTLKGYELLVPAIKGVLAEAVEVGGTTLRDFVGSDGNPGYFQQQLNVYGRAGQPCRRCSCVLKNRRVGQRATVFCPKCQRSQGFGRS